METATAEATWLRTRDIAKRFGVELATVWKWIFHGKTTPTGIVRLQAKRIGSQYRIRQDWLEEWERAINADMPPIMETVREAETRARHDQAAARKALGG